jgi:curli biogenesis system outer membrane secretion channel CsgG
MKHATLVSAAITLTLAVSAGAAAQDARPVVAVVDFTNDVANASWFGGSAGHDLAGMLSNELSSTGDFDVVERDKINAVLAEQDLARSGRVRAGSGPAAGNVTGAHYLITGTVSGYSETASNTGGGINFRGFHIGGGKSQAYIAIDLRVIDAETSQVVYSRTIEGRSTDSNVDVGGETWRGFGGEFQHSQNTPVSKAIRATLVYASGYLDCVMVKRDGCIATYNAQEQRRRKSDTDALHLDGG